MVFLYRFIIASEKLKGYNDFRVPLVETNQKSGGIVNDKNECTDVFFSERM